MLELIGLIALIYLAIKFLPGILLFFVKLIICLVAILLLLDIIYWLLPIGNPIIVIGL